MLLIPLLIITSLVVYIIFVGDVHNIFREEKTNVKLVLTSKQLELLLKKYYDNPSNIELRDMIIFEYTNKRNHYIYNILNNSSDCKEKFELQETMSEITSEKNNSIKALGVRVNALINYNILQSKNIAALTPIVENFIELFTQLQLSSEKLSKMIYIENKDSILKQMVDNTMFEKYSEISDQLIDLNYKMSQLPIANDNPYPIGCIIASALFPNQFRELDPKNEWEVCDSKIDLRGLYMRGYMPANFIDNTPSNQKIGEIVPSSNRPILSTIKNVRSDESSQPFIKSTSTKLLSNIQVINKIATNNIVLDTEQLFKINENIPKSFGVYYYIKVK